MIGIATPEITRIAATELAFGGDPLVGDFDYAVERFMEIGSFSDPSEDLMEFAGRACYQSFHKPNPSTRKNADYLRNIIDQGHESVLEHATVSYYITGVSRALTHELVRHRHFNYSQQSQRFVNEEEARVVLPPAIAPDSEAADLLRREFESALETYKDLVAELQPELEASGLDKFAARKQAREAARAVLPNCVETRIVVTGNHRAFRQFLWRRLHPSADMEIRRLSFALLKDLHSKFPAIYEDIEKELNDGTF